MDKYLSQYSEPGTAAVQAMPAAEPWQQVLVLPVCNESTGILRPLPPSTGRSLMIVVVNQSETAARHVSLANQEFAAEVRERFTKCWQSEPQFGLSLHRDASTPRDLLLVDRFTAGLRYPPEGGVGHARKTGADLAAQLINLESVRSPWIHCSDADVTLPGRYFSCSQGMGNELTDNTAALVYPFRHCKDDSEQDQRIARLTRLYEYSLRYYVAGLTFAGSPYAFHTIGSTVAVNARHYARVRGFPRRQAGEDFYLLNKLAKLGSIHQLNPQADCEPIEIAARLSDRVPFGTGAATAKLMEMNEPGREFMVYHPAVFNLLRSWLETLPALWREQVSDPGAILSRSDLPELVSGLEEAGARRALQHALRQSSDESQFMRQMHTWFDAFRSLKLIHYLRDNQLPSIGLKTLLAMQNINHLLDHEPELRDLHEQLCGLEWDRNPGVAASA